ncbi:MAG: hypothetical protein HYV07_14335 [Deltaproteobacteria bacterium]|nr:hypothetical protein [Deltaproteobacteria bacterium]
MHRPGPGPVGWRHPLIALAILSSVSPASATVLEALSLDELAARADSVVIGVIGSKSSVRSLGQLFTETEIIVEQTLLGEERRSLVLTQLGGEDRGQVIELVGDAKLLSGSRMLLFTYRHTDGNRYLVGMGQGAFLIQGETWVREIEASLQRPDGRIDAPRGRSTGTLAALVRAICGERSEPAGRSDCEASPRQTGGLADGDSLRPGAANSRLASGGVRP